MNQPFANTQTRAADFAFADAPGMEPLLGLPPDLAAGRRVTVLAVHHIDVGGIVYCGGAEKYTRTVIRALLECGARVHVGYSGNSIYDDLLDCAHPRQLTVERTNWIDVNLSGDARLHLRTMLQRRRWLRSTRADTVFVVQQAGGGAFGASILAARSVGMRVIVSARQQPLAIPDGSPRLYWRRRLPAMAASAILFNSRRVADAYAADYRWPAEKFHVIPNGERADHPPREISHPRRILCVGRVTEAKGADVLLAAFERLAPRFADARLIFVGDGPDMKALRARATAQGLASRVRFAGHQRDRDAFFAEADLCVQLSRRESMSNSVLEAMARGLPCVVTDVGGMTELVVDGQTGFVVSPGDALAATGAIQRLLENADLCRRMGRAAQARVRERFDLGDVMRRTVRAILGE
ncbi:MAG: glycosyltransferase family 4 protein [Planctomycetes bacterium]|nr:glycosyltransferase family 4 protein [Planctomycetota bacterium]